MLLNGNYEVYVYLSAKPAISRYHVAGRNNHVARDFLHIGYAIPVLPDPVRDIASRETNWFGIDAITANRNTQTSYVYRGLSAAIDRAKEHGDKDALNTAPRNS